MKKGIFILFTAASLALVSCGGGESSKEGENKGDSAKSTEAPKINETHFTEADLADLDLSANGIPVIAKAPKDSKVMKYDVNGDIIVYGGKFFKVTYSKMEGEMVETMNTLRDMATNTELNPSFDSLEEDADNGFLKKDKEGKLSFVVGVPVDEKSCVIITPGMPIDISPDKFYEYSNDDIMIMFQSAIKAAKK